MENTQEVDLNKEVPEKEQPLSEPPDGTDRTTEDTPHPLEPGGKRFQQVWKRAKSAEDKMHQEREARIAAEAKLQTLKEVGLSSNGQGRDKEYTWTELENMIAEGKMTRVEALDYRDALLIRKAKAEAKAEFEATLQTNTTVNTTEAQLRKYKELVPDAADPESDSDSRKRVEAEFAWLVEVHGMPKTPVDRMKMELTAARNAFGSIESLERRKEGGRMTRESRETTQETYGGSARRTSSKDDGDANTPPKGLSAQEIAHYQKMIDKSSAYPNGWADVRKELAYQKPRLTGRR